MINDLRYYRKRSIIILKFIGVLAFIKRLKNNN